MGLPARAASQLREEAEAEERLAKAKAQSLALRAAKGGMTDANGQLQDWAVRSRVVRVSMRERRARGAPWACMVAWW